MKNTKPNRDITAEEETLNELVIYVSQQTIMYDWSKEDYEEWEAMLRQTFKQALTKQKEEIVKSLRMDRTQNWVMHHDSTGSSLRSVNEDEVTGYRIAVDEFNKKLDKI